MTNRARPNSRATFGSDPVPSPADYPAPADLVTYSISTAALAVAFYDTCVAGHLPSSTTSLLTNTYLQALLLGKTLDTTGNPPDTG